MDIAQFREQYPQYNDMSDDTLADKLYQSHYSDIPRDQFERSFRPQQGANYGAIEQGVRDALSAPGFAPSMDQSSLNLPGAPQTAPVSAPPGQKAAEIQTPPSLSEGMDSQIGPDLAPHSFTPPSPQAGPPTPPSFLYAPDFQERYKDAVQNSTGGWDYLEKLFGFGFGEALQRVKSWGIGPGEDGAAKAENIMALSDQFKVSPVLVAENYEAFNKQAGFNPDIPGSRFVPGAAMAAATILGAGLPLLPIAGAGGISAAEAASINAARLVPYVPMWKMALGYAGFEAEENANAYLRSSLEGKSFWQTKPYSLADLSPNDSSDLTKTVLNLMDLFGKGAALHAGYNGLNSGWKALAYDTVSRAVPGKTLYVSPEDLHAAFASKYQMPDEDMFGPHDEQYGQFLRNMGIGRDEVDWATRQGVDIELPLSSIVGSIDAPWFVKVKNILHVSPYEDLTHLQQGDVTVRPHAAGLLEAPEEAGVGTSAKPAEDITDNIINSLETPVVPEASVIQPPNGMEQGATVPGQEPETVASGISRNDFIEAINRNQDIPQEQREAAIAIADARAASWARTEGKSPEEWYPKYLAGVRRGETPPALELPANDPRVVYQSGGAPAKPEEILPSPGGSKDWGQIDQQVAREIGRQAAPIRLEFGSKEGTDRRGWLHIKSDHEKEILSSGYSSIDAFINDVVTGYDQIRKGQGSSLILVKHNGKSKVAFVELRPSESGDYYSVKSAFPSRENYLEKYESLWQRSAPSQPETGAGPSRTFTSQDAGGKERSAEVQSNEDIISKSELERKLDKLEQQKKGATEFLEDGKAILHLFESSDVSTLMHEFAHIFRRQLSPEDMAIAAAWAGLKPAEWDTKSEEKFARGFEKYCAEGVAPSPQLRGIFQKLKAWMLDIYKSLKNLKVTLNDDIRAVFDRLLSTEEDQRAKNDALDSINGVPARKLGPAADGIPTPGMSRADFIQAINENQNIPQEQREAAIAIADARAASWARTEGKSPEDWYPTYLAGVRGGKGLPGEQINVFPQSDFSISDAGGVKRIDVKADGNIDKGFKLVSRYPELDAPDLFPKETALDSAKETAKKYYDETLRPGGVSAPAFHGEKVSFTDAGLAHISGEDERSLSEKNVNRRLALLPKAKAVIENAPYADEVRDKGNGTTDYGLLGRFKDGTVVRAVIRETNQEGKIFRTVYDWEDVSKKIKRTPSSGSSSVLPSLGVGEAPSGQDGFQYKSRITCRQQKS